MATRIPMNIHIQPKPILHSPKKASALKKKNSLEKATDHVGLSKRDAIKRRALWFILYLHFPFAEHIIKTYFSSHSYGAKNDSSFNDGATGDALQEPPEASTCMRIFFLSLLLLYTKLFLRDIWKISCFNHVQLWCLKHTTYFFRVSLMRLFDLL